MTEINQGSKSATKEVIMTEINQGSKSATKEVIKTEINQESKSDTNPVAKSATDQVTKPQSQSATPIGTPAMLSFNSDNSKIEDIMESIGNDTVNHDEEHTVDEDPTVAEDTTGDETLLTVDGKTTGDEALLTVDEDTTVDAATGVDKLNENVVKQTDDVNHDEDTIGDEALPTGAVVE
eukprot:32245_1